ncbi:hypothetical protein QEZ54_08695 [Catellatospora sp. KI3]|uniref:hypothetical protein n=1 Tax=Catellatospora sp. KI3 TaxID=3041620 RepID=UPI0024829877|nr:hypothetical protein [Catellatospora sp. KI3]MDI1461040.1 hypothetical protein [Catellatospora sp. KI3]
MTAKPIRQQSRGIHGDVPLTTVDLLARAEVALASAASTARADRESIIVAETKTSTNRLLGRVRLPITPRPTADGS